ncbi:MAG: branched chain amino acid aminotransferase, partial [Flavobacteriaceae bacterium]|nr:branched chain amino acid aminotransferase [Flavobacteriaceae bacterium]
IGFGYENKKFELPRIEKPWSLLLKNKLNDIQYNISEDPYGWRTEA